MYLTFLCQDTVIPYAVILYCTVLYCTVLYCTVLYYTVLYCTVLYCAVLQVTKDTYKYYKKNISVLHVLDFLLPKHCNNLRGHPVLYCTVMYCTADNKRYITNIIKKYNCTTCT